MAYAYVVEVKLKNRWNYVKLMVSTPGKAVHDLLESTKTPKKDLVRINRLTQSEDFVELIHCGYELGIHEDAVGEEVEFEDKNLTLGDV